MSTLSIDQLLRAAQILEQSATLQQLVQQQQQQQQQQQLQFCKFGEDYQEKLVMSKMRSVNVDSPLINAAGGSTGSSRRSTPSGSMFSNCSSTPNSSSPNSPPTTLLLPTTTAAPTSAFVRVQNYAAGDASDVRVASRFGQNLLEQHQQQHQQHQQQQQSASTTIQHETSANSSASSAAPTNSVSMIVPNFNAATHFRNSPSSSSVVSMSIRQSRAAHNELEKNRRANLRGYLDKLKSVLPPDSDSTRDTTLSLLTRARNYLRTVKQEKDTLLEHKKAAISEFLRLRQELENISTASCQASSSSAADVDVEMSERDEIAQTPSISGENIRPEFAASNSSPAREHLDAEINRLSVGSASAAMAALSQQQHQQHRSAFSVIFGDSQPSTSASFSSLEQNDAANSQTSACMPQERSSSVVTAVNPLTSSANCGPSTTESVQSFVMPSLVLPQISSLIHQQQQEQQQQQQQQSLQLAQNTAAAKTVIDLYTEGLLPALPLLYPYGDLILRHANFHHQPSC